MAKAAGVSPMTVSNVINSHPYVKAATRDRVVKAMNDLDYRVNVAARNLRSGRTFTIGLAVAELDRPYYGQLAARIVAEAARHNLHVLIELTGASRENEIDALGLSRNRMYDGLILSAVGLGAADVDLLKVDFPIVIMGERIFDGPVDHVAMANTDGAKAATRHLIDRGCRRIAIVDDHRGNETDASSLRYAGYRAALEEAGLDVDPELRVNLDVPSFSLQDGRDAGRRLVDSRVVFDGIFCVTDTVALGVIRGLADGGVRVPDDVLVVGFDNIDEAAFNVPSLSTIDPDHALMAKTAVDLLVRRIAEAGDRSTPIEFVSSYRVVERESTQRRPEQAG
ncbi:MAG: LacI family DNA-binding transcriptional regulator [Pseudolysinimonas sp.]